MTASRVHEHRARKHADQPCHAVGPDDGRGPANLDRRRSVRAAAQMAVLLWAAAVPGMAADSLHPSQPGVIVLEAARDSTRDYVWVPLPELGERCLIWSAGAATLGDGLSTGSFGVHDLTLPYTTDLLGVSAGKRLQFVAGRYKIDQPLLLTDGRVRLLLSKGEITLSDGLISYHLPTDRPDSRAQYMLLAGIVLLIAVLLLRVRSRLPSR